jgi:hypothetical protein
MHERDDAREAREAVGTHDTPAYSTATMNSLTAGRASTVKAIRMPSASARSGCGDAGYVSSNRRMNCRLASS